MGNHCDRSRAAPAIGWCTALPVIGLGVAAIVRDTEHQATWVHIPTLFGTFLCVSVIAQFAWLARHRIAGAADIAACVSRLSRQVYLILYALAGAKELQLLCAPGESHFNGPALADSMQALQPYLASGLLALIAIRAMAAMCRPGNDALRFERRAAPN
jgi:hypothetical protein